MEFFFFLYNFNSIKKKTTTHKIHFFNLLQIEKKCTYVNITRSSQVPLKSFQNNKLTFK